MSRFFQYLNSHHRAAAFLITLALYAFTYLNLGWWTDAYQTMMDYSITGEFTGYYPQTGDPFPEYMAGSAKLFAWLGRLYPLRWMAFFLNTFLFISIYVIYYQVLKKIADLDWKQKLAVIVLLSAFFAESVALYHMVRVCMFMGIAGVMVVLNDDVRLNKYFPKQIIPYLILFALGAWVRFNVLLFVLFFVAIALYLYKRPLKPLVPFAIVLVFFSINNLTFLNPERYNQLFYYFLYDAEFKLLFAAHFQPEVHLETALDSVKYQAIQQGFFADEVNLGKDFYDKIGIFDNFSRFSTGSLMYAFGNFIWAMMENVHYLLTDIILVVFYLMGGSKAMKNYRWKTLGLFFIFYGVVFAISFLKMENRFLVPFQLCFLLVIIFLYQPSLIFEKAKLYWLYGFLAITLPITAYFTYNKVAQERYEYETYEQVFDKMADTFPNHTFLVNTAMQIKNKPYQLFGYNHDFPHFYFFNFHSGTLSPAYRPYLENECNCNTGAFAPFYDYLAEDRMPVVMLDHPSRVRMLEKYLEKVHGTHHRFERVEIDSITQQNLFALGYRDSLSVYKMVE